MNLKYFVVDNWGRSKVVQHLYLIIKSLLKQVYYQSI